MMLVFIAHFSVCQHNQLCVNTLSLHAQKLKNFASKILLCAELIVLSVRNANIVSDGKASAYLFTLFTPSTM